MKRVLLFFILGVSIFLVEICGFSQITLDKDKVKLEIKPGETITDTITVHNHSEEDILVKVYLQDFVYLPPFDGRKKAVSLGSTSRSCGLWTHLSPQEFILSGREKREVTYTIHVPLKVNGGYYSVLFFEESPKFKTNTTGVTLTVRVGCSFFLETYDKKKQVHIESISVVSEGLRGDFLNAGNVILFFKSSFYVLNEKNIVVDRGEIQTFYLPPEEKIPFTISLPKDLPPDEYTGVITLDLFEEGEALVKEIDFVKKGGKIHVLKVRN